MSHLISQGGMGSGVFQSCPGASHGPPGGGLLRAILADSRVLSSLSLSCLSPHPFLSPRGPLLTGQGSFHQKLLVISFPQQPPSSHCPGPAETHWLEGLTLALAARPLWRAFRTFESLPAHADLERCLWERRGCASLLFQGQKSEDVLPSCYVGDVIFIPQSTDLPFFHLHPTPYPLQYVYQCDPHGCLQNSSPSPHSTTGKSQSSLTSAFRGLIGTQLFTAIHCSS